MKLIIALALLATSLTVQAEPNKYRTCRDLSDNVSVLSELKSTYNPNTASPETTQTYQDMIRLLGNNQLLNTMMQGYERTSTRRWEHSYEACIDYIENYR